LQPMFPFRVRVLRQDVNGGGVLDIILSFVQRRWCAGRGRRASGRTIRTLFARALTPMATLVPSVPESFLLSL
jgi:hypothetical protein